jgi:2-polyprenyl-3-methyl-5-hydroxy-6-metoxy-1,4-benzoquinol methylase
MYLESTNQSEILKIIKKINHFPKLINYLKAEVPDVLSNDSVENTFDLMENPAWPEAVQNLMIVKTETEKITRATNIIYVCLNNEIDNIKLLDFGCGEGHVVQKASQKTTLAVGYDIVQQWKEGQKGLTTSLEEVKNQSPYDKILLHDVLDHCSDPVQVLNQVRELLSDTGTIHIRCHPWCSRHGGHLFKTVNKAYAHFFFDDEVNRVLSEGQYPLQKVIHPLSTYCEWINQSQLKSITGSPVIDRPPLFFKQNFTSIIQSHWKPSHVKAIADGVIYPENPMSISFIDFICTVPN